MSPPSLPPRFATLLALVLLGVAPSFFAAPAWADSRYSPPVRTPWHPATRTESQTHWQAVTLRTNTATGKVHAQTNSYTELGAGLNVRQADGQFAPADPSFQITATGAEATGTTHQVVVPADLWLGEGIKVIQPGGQSVTFQPLGLDYFDPVDGRSVLLDAVTNAVGWLTASNEIIYSNCFTRIKASIRLRNTASGVTHDVLLHERPPDPASLGLSPDSRLEMLTEQVQGPAPAAQARFIRRETDPQRIASMVAPDFLDADLSFSGMKMARGKAFSTSRRTNAFSSLPQPVGKSVEVIDQRRIMIEAIEHRQAAPGLRELPLATNTLNQTTAALDLGSPARAASGVPNPAPSLLASQREAGHLPAIRLLPPQAAAGTADKAVQRAAIQRVNGSPARASIGVPNSPRSARLSTPAGAPVDQSLLTSAATKATLEAAPLFVLDYELVNAGGLTNFTFRGDTTYFISGAIPIYGSNVVEGGAVLKYDLDGLFFQAGATLFCDTTNYLPAVFTSLDDNSLGEIIAGSSGEPYRVNATALDFTDGHPELRHLRFKHLDYAVFTHENATLTARHVQFVDVMVGLATTDSTTLHAFNALADGADWFYAGEIVAFRGEHLTVHNGTTVGYAANTNSTLLLRNSVLVEMQYGPNYAGTVTYEQVVQTDNETAQFATVGGGQHYLSSTSTYRDLGTNTIDATLAADLAQMTTYAPTVLTGTVSNDLVLSRQWIRDSAAPDLGWHYPAVDYLARDLILQNCTVTLTNGVVLAGAVSNSSAAIYLNPGKFFSVGLAARMNHLLRASQVQEHPQPRVSQMIYDGLQDQFYPEIRLRFTALSTQAGDSILVFTANNLSLLEVSHCSIQNGLLLHNLYGGGYGQTVAFTNNVFRRSGLRFEATSPATVYAYNNTFAPAGSLSLTGGREEWELKDNLFDHVALTQDAEPITSDYNAYFGMTNRLAADTHYVTNATFTYTNGPLGRYYHHSTSLVDQGSRNSTNAGLYHFTTRASQLKETNTVADLGAHYVATDANGTPLDYDGDGVPDYWEDANGNGSHDSAAGENDWRTYTSPNGLSIGSPLRVYSPLK